MSISKEKLDRQRSTGKAATLAKGQKGALLPFLGRGRAIFRAAFIFMSSLVMLKAVDHQTGWLPNQVVPIEGAFTEIFITGMTFLVVIAGPVSLFVLSSCQLWYAYAPLFKHSISTQRN
ncbi:MAG: hypothetical protein MPJ24_05180 [Pirellulaceae bacterium]|nr:hypothetical protein [Pirellulaceae bacterium]